MANYYQSSRHDISITDISTGDVLGFMLAKDDKTELPLYAEYDSKYLADQFFTGTPSVVNMNPQEEIPLVLYDWRSGFGQYIYDSADSKRYWESIGMDMRHKEMGIL